MTAPSFQLDQPGGAGSGTSGSSRIDLWEGVAITLTCLNPPPGATFLWEVVYLPTGSAAVITNPNNSVASITADLPTVTFRLKLTINSGGPGLEFIFLVSCPKNNTGVTVNRGWRIPAFEEQNLDQNQGGNLLGYSPDYAKIVSDIYANAAFPGVNVTSGTGAPNGAVLGHPGDVYLNKSGGAGTTLYVKESGSGTNTGWVGK